MTDKNYADRDHMALGDYYTRHVSAMTGEGLHSKSAIAAELAHRDAEIDRLRAALAAAQAPQPARVAPEVPALDWPAMLLLLNEYAMHVHDASEHQAESRADISKTAALKSLERIRMAMAAHTSRWQAVVHELIWSPTPPAKPPVEPARVALPADLIEYMRRHLDRQRDMLVGFTKLDNERRRAAKLDDWIAAVAGIPGTDGAA